MLIPLRTDVNVKLFYKLVGTVVVGIKKLFLLHVCKILTHIYVKLI